VKERDVTERRMRGKVEEEVVGEGDRDDGLGRDEEFNKSWNERKRG
jgi:hypothetical protein